MAIIIPDQGKTCTQCHKWKYYSEYYKDTHISTGLRAACKECVNSINKLCRFKRNAPPAPLTIRQRRMRIATQRWHRAFNREKINQKRKERYHTVKLENPEKHRQRAERKKIYWHEVFYPRLKARKQEARIAS